MLEPPPLFVVSQILSFKWNHQPDELCHSIVHAIICPSRLFQMFAGLKTNNKWHRDWFFLNCKWKRELPSEERYIKISLWPRNCTSILWLVKVGGGPKMLTFAHKGGMGEEKLLTQSWSSLRRSGEEHQWSLDPTPYFCSWRHTSRNLQISETEYQTEQHV